MEIICTKEDVTLIVKIIGDVDHHYAEEIKSKVEKELNGGTYKNIIFDFQKVLFMDSSGIGMIIGRYKNLENVGGKVAIAGMNKEVSRLFDISGLCKIINKYENVEKALGGILSGTR